MAGKVTASNKSGACDIQSGVARIRATWQIHPRHYGEAESADHCSEGGGAHSSEPSNYTRLAYPRIEARAFLSSPFSAFARFAGWMSSSRSFVPCREVQAMHGVRDVEYGWKEAELVPSLPSFSSLMIIRSPSSVPSRYPTRYCCPVPETRHAPLTQCARRVILVPRREIPGDALVPAPSGDSFLDLSPRSEVRERTPGSSWVGSARIVASSPASTLLVEPLTRSSTSRIVGEPASTHTPRARVLLVHPRVVHSVRNARCVLPPVSGARKTTRPFASKCARPPRASSPQSAGIPCSARFGQLRYLCAKEEGVSYASPSAGSCQIMLGFGLGWRRARGLRWRTGGRRGRKKGVWKKGWRRGTSHGGRGTRCTRRQSEALFFRYSYSICSSSTTRGTSARRIPFFISPVLIRPR
ncbi:hypothetical protein B0H13DRAFT_2268252 [Mycena leptocephala]|nr:hypothetical protein B0H13DRAFT_2268252 [Mycena leptocephala]